MGKGTLIRLLLDRFPRMRLSISATTREPREGERDGVDYRFMTPKRFQERIDAGEFLEWAEYAGNRYGTLLDELERDACPLVLEIEVQGARQVKARLPEARSVFIAPPSEEALRTRLVGRGSDRPEQIEKRLAVAKEEMAERESFDRIVVNDDLDAAVQELGEYVASIWSP